MRTFLSWLFLALVLVLTAAVLVTTSEPGQILNLIRSADTAYLWMGALALLLFIALEMVMMHLMLNHKAEHRHPFFCAFKATVIGQYFNLVTPFSSGGQPLQLHALVQEGVSVKQGTAVLVNKFLVFQIGVTLYCMGLILYRTVVHHDPLPAGNQLMALGVAINCIGLAGLVLTIYLPAFLKRLLAAVIHGLHAVRLLKRGLYWINWCDHRVEEYSAHIREMIGMKRLMIPVTLLTALQLTAYFSIGWFVYRALGQQGHSFLDILTLQSLLYVSVAFIPTPGSSGVSEGGYFLLFSSVISRDALGGAVLLWRGISYYLNLLVSGLLTLGLSLKRLRLK